MPPAAERRAHRVTARTKDPPLLISRRAAAPIRVLIRIEVTTYGESVISTPTWEISPPSGPCRTAPRTHPARMQPSKISPNVCASRRARSSCWSAPRPVALEQMNVRSSTRATSLGPRRTRSCSAAAQDSAEGEVPFSRAGCQPVPFVVRAITPDDRVRLVSSAISSTPGQLGQPRRACSRSGLRWPCLSLPERTNVRRHARRCACDTS